MFKCCSALQHDFDFSDRIKPCKIHGKPILFVCMNLNTCQEKALFCTDCSDMHKGHNWQTVANFFNEEVKEIITNKSHAEEHRIQDVLDRTLDNYQKARARIQYKLIQVQDALKKYFEQLKMKYPPLVGSEFREDQLIDNQKMSTILQILREREINDWIEDFQQDFTELIKPTQGYTIEQLQDLQILIRNKQWDVETERQKNFKSYLQKHFPAKEVDDPFYFRFSEADKNSYISVDKKGLQAIYQDDTYENIQKPAILTTRKLSPQNNKVFFKIQNIAKTALVFDASKIGLGVCIPHNARQYNFTNLHKHSHGAYMMFSDGRVFHSKLPEFIDSKAGFSFGKNDIVQMWIDYSQKVIHFERKGLLRHKFQMQLSLNEKFMSKLRPFVLFEGDQGAVVELLSNKQGKQKQQKPKSLKCTKTKSSKFTQATSM